MDNNRLLVLLKSALPRIFVRDLMRSIDWAYDESVSAMSNDTLLGEPETRYMIPHYRRSILEHKLRVIASDAGLTTRIAQNNVGNYEYTELFAGGFPITIIHHSSTWRIVRHSIFRQNHARLNMQLDQLQLFRDESLVTVPDAPLNAIIYHGTDYYEKTKAGFIKIGFPDQGNKKWAARFDCFDLLQTFAEESPNEDDSRLIVTWKKKSGEVSKN